ncbi:hypothetical protein [Streptomyces sp. NPDC047841]|uniref:hypothetical protein n=1 Tax=Streptomyces sp. NPDC047841 TaxID=3154708 RepID=UPI0034539F88
MIDTSDLDVFLGLDVGEGERHATAVPAGVREGHGRSVAYLANLTARWIADLCSGEATHATTRVQGLLEVCEEYDLLGLDIEAEHWIATAPSGSISTGGSPSRRLISRRALDPRRTGQRVWQQARQGRVEEGTHVIPQQVSHPSTLSGSPMSKTIHRL